MSKWTRQALAALSLALLLVAACGDDDGADVRSVGESSGSASGSASASGSGSTATEAACTPVGDPADADVTVEYTLDEFSFTGPDAIDEAGAVAFEATNDGTEPHELAIIRTDGDIDELPTTDTGNVDEAALPDGAFIGEIEGFPAGETCAGVFDLDPGRYVLACLIEEDEGGEIESHFAEGMGTLVDVG